MPAQPTGVIWIDQEGSGPLVLKGPAHWYLRAGPAPQVRKVRAPVKPVRAR